MSSAHLSFGNIAAATAHQLIRIEVLAHFNIASRFATIICLSDVNESVWRVSDERLNNQSSAYEATAGTEPRSLPLN